MTNFSTAPADGPPLESGPAGDFLVVDRFTDPLEAQVLKDLLVSEGIPATLGDFHQVQTNTLWATALGGVRLMVPAAFVPRARELMAHMRSGALAIEGDDDPALAPPVVATELALWNPDAAALLSAWLTPVFGAALLAVNARTLGDRALQRTADTWLALSVAVVLAGAWLMRELDASPWRGFQVSGFVLPFTVVWYLFVAHAQSGRIARAHGRRYVHRSLLQVAVPTALALALFGASGVLQPQP